VDTQSIANPNPLQLGQTLYDLSDITIVGSKISSGTVSPPTYQRYTYANGKPSLAQDATLNVDSIDNIKDVKAVDVFASAKQCVLVLTDKGLISQEVLGTNSDGYTETYAQWPFEATNVQFIIDSNPLALTCFQVLLIGQETSNDLGHEATNIFLWTLNISGDVGTLSDPIKLPGVQGLTLKGACLARCQTNARLIAFFMGSSGLQVADFGSDILLSLANGATISPTPPTLVSVVDCKPGLSFDYTTGMLIPSSGNPTSNGNQQIAIVYPWVQASSTSAYGYCISILDFIPTNQSAKTYTMKVVSTGTFSVGSCVPAASSPSEAAFAITSGSLLSNGLDQLVVGFCGTYGSPAVGGCVCLSLLTYGPKELVLSSVQFVGCLKNSDNQWVPFCSLGLVIAIGVFGTAIDLTEASFGIVVIGWGATLHQLAKNQGVITGAIIPVDPASAQLPETDANTPANLNSFNANELSFVPADAPRYIAMPSDVCGNSVVLGAPTLINIDKASQIIAYIQAIPYEEACVAYPPSVSFTINQTKINGTSVASIQSWTFSESAGISLGLGPSSLSAHMTSTYGVDFSTINDNIVSTTEILSSTIYNYDMIIVYNISYTVWEYPIYQPAKTDKQSGSLAVIFPDSGSLSPIQALVNASSESYGYIPSHQPGLLISYPMKPTSLTNYTPSLQIFSPLELSILATGTNSITYSASNMTSSTQSVTSTIFNSLTLNFDAHFNSNLFEYLPLSFGINVSEGETYSSSNVSTTSVTCTSDLSITFTTSNLAEGYEDYFYQFTPYVYFDNKYGCLIVNYTVDLASGQTFWSNYYMKPNLVCFQIYPFSTNLLYKSFTRMISFTTDDEGSFLINVTVFNASFSPSTDASCTLYLGQPETSAQTVSIPSGANQLGCHVLPTVNATESVTFSMSLAPEASLSKGDCVTAVLKCGGTTNIYWSVYPADYFPHLNLK
jgi:hypothetical protein